MNKICFVIGCFSAILAFAACHNAGPVNLVVNGGAEASHSDSVPPGWTNISGHWHAVEGDSAVHYYAMAAEGKKHFFEGQDGAGVLQQDIPVDKYAADIDGGKQRFVFAGRVTAFPQDPPDQCLLILTALDKDRNRVLYTYRSDSISSVGKWQLVTDTFMAPASTRLIRIQLNAIRRNGADNDGYFDDISLMVMDSGGWKIWLLCGGIILALVCGALIFRRFRKPVRRLPTGSAHG